MFADELHGQYSKAYLRHLIRCDELLGAMVASVFNLRFYLWLVKEAREHILQGDFATWKNGAISQFMHRL
jgi:queuine tRNA-ribosyltransferase